MLCYDLRLVVSWGSGLLRAICRQLSSFGRHLVVIYKSFYHHSVKFVPLKYLLLYTSKKGNI